MKSCWLVVLCACGFQHGALPSPGNPQDGGADGLGDAVQVTTDAPPDTIGTGAWGDVHPVFASGGMVDDDPSATADLLELYFNRNADIYVTKRSSITDAWATPQLVAEVSSTSNETTPEITSDGLVMFIGSDRPGTVGAGDIWMATRASRGDAWSTPVHVDALSSGTDNAAAAPTDDLLAIVQIGNPSGTDVQMYMATRAAATATWPTPMLIANVNSTASDFSPMLSQDRLTLYFDSTRSGNEDLYVATRATVSATFSTPTVIAELSDPVAQETDPWVSPDGHHMLFVRDNTLYEASR